jgi:hypothetical protein
MKKYTCLSIIILGLLFLQTNTPAQDDRKVKPRIKTSKPRSKPSSSGKNSISQPDKVYLKADRLLSYMAERKLASAGRTNLDNFGQGAERAISLEARPERAAAALLLSLQNEPERTFGGFADARNAASQQKSLQADELITEFVKALIRASRSESAGADDPLRKYVYELESFEGQEILNEDLIRRLGTGVEREERAAILLIQIREDFSPEALQRIREALKMSEAAALLPYPLCLIKKPCPR